MRKTGSTAFKKNTGTKLMVLSALFTALVAVGAFLKIPIPYLPITLQVFFVLLAGLILGSRYGGLSVTAYALLGLAGVPIFTQGGGISYLLQPSFGYIIGFCAAAFTNGFVYEKLKKRYGQHKYLCMLTANITAVGVIYLIGVPYYYAVCNIFTDTPVTWSFVLIYCFLTTLPGDIIHCLLTAFIALKVKKHIR